MLEYCVSKKKVGTLPDLLQPILQICERFINLTPCRLLQSPGVLTPGATHGRVCPFPTPCTLISVWWDPEGPGPAKGGPLRDLSSGGVPLGPVWTPGGPWGPRGGSSSFLEFQTAGESGGFRKEGEGRGRGRLEALAPCDAVRIAGRQVLTRHSRAARGPRVTAARRKTGSL